EIMRYEEVSSVYLMSGAYDLVVIIEGKSLREVSSFVSENLSTMDNIISTATHFILKKYKSEGVVLDSNNSSRQREMLI
ncbi:MAG: Lrp/AsnC ligand binding domain-containing protein, partial [Clostridia bacterium]